MKKLRRIFCKLGIHKYHKDEMAEVVVETEDGRDEYWAYVTYCETCGERIEKTY